MYGVLIYVLANVEIFAILRIEMQISSIILHQVKYPNGYNVLDQFGDSQN